MVLLLIVVIRQPSEKGVRRFMTNEFWINGGDMGNMRGSAHMKMPEYPGKRHRVVPPDWY